MKTCVATKSYSVAGRPRLDSQPPVTKHVLTSELGFSEDDIGCDKEEAGESPEQHRSPFHHTFWVGFVLLWAFSCYFFVTANIVLTETKL
jgi:hypothetical protein